MAVVCDVAWAGKRNPLLLHIVTPPPANDGPIISSLRGAPPARPNLPRPWISDSCPAEQRVQSFTASIIYFKCELLAGMVTLPGLQFGNARPVGCAASQAVDANMQISRQPDSTTMPKCSPPEQNGEPSRTFILRPLRKARTGKVGDDATWVVVPEIRGGYHPPCKGALPGSSITCITFCG